MINHRDNLFSIYQAAVQAVNGKRCVSEFLTNNPIDESVYLIAIGKASVAMAQGAYDMLGNKIQDGLVITKTDHAESLPCECIEASHPVPDESSLKAGSRLLQFIADTPKNAKILFLLSGGASSLVEVLKENKTLDDLQSLNEALLSSGVDIVETNKARTELSTIKSGGLIGYLGERRVIQLLINDVPNDELSSVGSGLLFKDRQSPYETHVVASIQVAMQAAKAKAESLAYQVDLKNELMTGDACETVEKLITETKPSKLTIAGGETSLSLPENPGKGGRNQHMALYAAKLIQDKPGCYFLAAGTDGTDGPTDAAGGIVDAQTVSRAKLDIDEYIKNANAYPFLKAADSLIITGPTGTNVMDLVLLLG